MLWLESTFALVAVALALALRPWRAFGQAGPPWPWIAACALLPLVWGADRYVAMPVAQPLSGASLLLLMMGWPLTVIALVPVALATMWMAGLDAAETLSRAVWLGLAPATVALALGAAVRRWLPHHLFVYILGRGFFVQTGGLATSAVWRLPSPSS